MVKLWWNAWLLWTERHHVAGSLKHATFLRFIFTLGVEKSGKAGSFWEWCTKVPRDLYADSGFVPAIVGDGSDDRREDFVMHEWMMGVGFIAILMTPCFIAMRPGAEDVDDGADDQETAGVRSARRLKLL
jgi:hypothetical protein